MPVAQSRVTAIGYHGVDNGALELEPVGGKQTKASSGGSSAASPAAAAGLAYYHLGGRGPPRRARRRRTPGTDVYAPVDGTIIGITDFVISGRARQPDRHPAGELAVPSSFRSRTSARIRR